MTVSQEDKREIRHRGGGPREDRGRDQRDVATSQGAARIGDSLWGERGPAHTSILGFSSLGPGEKGFCCLKLHACGSLLQRPQETNTDDKHRTVGVCMFS